jgi:hypothetical protein
MAINFVYSCVLVSGVYLNLPLQCIFFSRKPTMQQTGNLANSVTCKLHKQRAYLTWHTVMFWKLHTFFIGNTFAKGWLVSCSFHLMLCKCFQDNMERIWKEHAAIKLCKWMCWWSNLVSLNGVSMWWAQLKQQISSRICLYTAMARSRPKIKVRRSESNNLC